MSNSFGKVCTFCRGTGLDISKQKLTFCEACDAKGKDGDGMLFQWPKGYDEDYDKTWAQDIRDELNQNKGW